MDSTDCLILGLWILNLLYFTSRINALEEQIADGKDS